MTMLRSTILCALLLLVTSPLLAVGGGGSCGRCEIPYPNEHSYADGFGTTAEAPGYCADRLEDEMELGWIVGGFVVKWIGGEAPAPGNDSSFTCYVCLNNSVPTDGPGYTSPPVSFAQAGWIALDAYPGAISAIEFFSVDDELHGIGGSYEVTIVNSSQRRAAVVRIDPFSGLATIVEEAAARPQ